MSQVSVEISLYPLTEQFVTPIADFIDRLNQYPELTVQTNCMSTQVFGPYGRTLEILAAEMQKTHADVPKASFVMKVLNGNLLTGSPTD
ncbi:MAG: hypothetical protein AAF358_20515 [Pseudomonadota bacterium]